MLDGADLQSPGGGKLQASMGPHHASTDPLGNAVGDGMPIVDQLGDDGDLGLAGQATKFHGGLGVAGTLADASADGSQGEYVAGPPEMGGAGVGIGQGSAGRGSIVGRDAGGEGGVMGIDADGVGGPVGVGVVDDHLGQIQGGGPVGGEGCADDAAGVADHKGHLLGGDMLGRDDEVALVLAGWGIQHDDEVAGREGGDAGWYGVEDGWLVGFRSHGDDDDDDSVTGLELITEPPTCHMVPRSAYYRTLMNWRPRQYGVYRQDDGDSARGFKRKYDHELCIMGLTNGVGTKCELKIHSTGVVPQYRYNTGMDTIQVRSIRYTTITT